jgi:hypothetical protein
MADAPKRRRKRDISREMARETLADFERALDDESRLLLMLDRAVAISRGNAEVRAMALRAQTQAAPVTDNRAELERELGVLQVRLKRWEEKLRGNVTTPRKLFMIKSARARADALTKEIRRLKSAAMA